MRLHHATGGDLILFGNSRKYSDYDKEQRRLVVRSGSQADVYIDLDKASGNALDRDTIRKARQDVDVVIQTLGVEFSPRAIFEGTTLFSESTRILVDAMKTAGVKRLIAVTGLGTGNSRGHGGLLYDAVVFPCS